MNEVLARDTAQRTGQGGTKQLVSSQVMADGKPGSGTSVYAAQFKYSDGSVETLWGHGKTGQIENLKPC